MIQDSVLQACRQLGCLNEMFIEGKRSLKDGAHILAYRSKIWVFPDEQSMEQASKRMLASIRKETGVKKFGGERSDLEERPDVLMASYSIMNDEKELRIRRGLNFNPRPESSVLVQKVAKALGVTRVFNDSEYGNDDVVVRSKNLAKEKTPTWGYHGTSSKYLMEILKHGLIPKPQQTNFDTVKHDKTVFLTLDASKAVFHSTQGVSTSSRIQGSNRHVQRSLRSDDSGMVPYQRIVLRVKVPDPSLIVADYDIDREGDQATYTDMHQTPHAAKARGTIPGNAKKVSMALGVFGYRGRILPQNIESIFIDRKVSHDVGNDDIYGEANLSDMSEFDPAFVRKWMNELDELTGGEYESIDLKSYLDDPERFIDEEKEARGDSDGE